MTAVRLGLVLDGPIAFDGTDYWTNLPMGRYCQRMSRVFGQIDIYPRCTIKRASGIFRM